MWRRDPRFGNLLPPRWEVRTICDLATRGTDTDKRLLFDVVDAVRARLTLLAALPLELAVTGFIEAISSQHGVRLDMLLACTGLNGRDPITQREVATVLGVSDQRVSQIVAQLYRQRDKVTPSGGIWMPQADAAVADGWPDQYTKSRNRRHPTLPPTMT